MDESVEDKLVEVPAVSIDVVPIRLLLVLLVNERLILLNVLESDLSP